MSAPDANIERKNTNHKPALLGIKGVMRFGALLLMLALFCAVSNGSVPGADGMVLLDVVHFAAAMEQSSGTFASQPIVSN